MVFVSDNSVMCVHICTHVAGVAQLVERLTENPDTMLAWVQVPGPAWDFFSPVIFQCRLSYGVRTAPPCAIACINICAHIKNPQTLAASPLFGHIKILHTLMGMGSTALVAAAPYPCKETRFSPKGQINTKKNFKKLCVCN